MEPLGRDGDLDEVARIDVRVSVEARGHERVVGLRRLRGSPARRSRRRPRATSSTSSATTGFGVELDLDHAVRRRAARRTSRGRAGAGGQAGLRRGRRGAPDAPRRRRRRRCRRRARRRGRSRRPPAAAGRRARTGACRRRARSCPGAGSSPASRSGWRRRGCRARRRASAAAPAAGGRRPRITAIRVPIVIASTWSWVTYIVVTPSSRWRPAISARSCVRSFASRFESGSSIRNTCGSRTIARPIATRWRCPPESARGLRLSRPSRPSRVAVFSTRVRISALGRRARAQREREVVEDGHVRVEGVVLEDHRHVALARVERVDEPLADADLALADLLEAGGHPQRRRLAASGGPDDHHQLAVGDLEVELGRRRASRPGRPCRRRSG